MPKFQRQITTRFSAFQFKMMAHDEKHSDSSSSFKAHLQADEQRSAFNAADMSVRLREIDIAPFKEGDPLTLIVRLTDPWSGVCVSHFMKEGEWLFIDDLMGPATGEVMTDEQFRELGAVQV